MNKSESKYYNTALLMDEALLLLLEKKEYEFITVKEICAKAGVNRSTFYLHYESIDDLLLETLEMINKRFNEAFNNKVIDINKDDKDNLFFITDAYLIPYLNFIKENKKIYTLIHDKPLIFKKQQTFKKLYTELFSVILDRYGVLESQKEYIFSYFSFGLVAVIQKWIENDCKDDIEEMAKLMRNLIGHSYEN